MQKSVEPLLIMILCYRVLLTRIENSISFLLLQSTKWWVICIMHCKCGNSSFSSSSLSPSKSKEAIDKQKLHSNWKSCITYLWFGLMDFGNGFMYVKIIFESQRKLLYLFPKWTPTNQNYRKTREGDIRVIGFKSPKSFWFEVICWTGKNRYEIHFYSDQIIN